MISEARERFLREIVERIPLDRIVEVHCFPPIRQGQMESGVAVIAAVQEFKSSGVQELTTPRDPGPDPVNAELLNSELLNSRLVIYTASYRWTRKGPERGKWIVDVVAEADAPLATVETVVRGVQERAGEAFDTERLTRADLEAALPPAVPPAVPAATPSAA